MPGTGSGRLRFDFPDAAGRPAPVLFEHPRQILAAHCVADVQPVMRAVERALGEGRYAAGFVAYEAAPAFDPALRVAGQPEVPLVWFGIFDAPVPSLGPTGEPATDTTPHTRESWTPDLAPAEHRLAVETVREAIARGDVYQANYTFRLRTRLDPGSLESRYTALVACHRPPYAAFLETGRWQVLSLSPELFFRIDGRRMVMKPMKGTAPRGLWVDDDEARAEALGASVKNRAENVMIVDLMRNDAGRIAEIGSVRTPSLFEIERYPSLFQMVSTVEATLRPEVTIGDVFTALFPAGSITGAPKTSSMRLLADLERAPRGIYCGALGFLSPRGDAVFSVAIRTMTVDARSGCAEYGVGGGITWDSVAGDEHAEAVAKAACLSLTSPFDLIETLRGEAGVCVRAARHLHRLSRSAAYFDFTCSLDDIAAALAAHAAEHPRGSRRIRLQLSRDGRTSVESRPLELPPASPPRVVLAATPVDRGSCFLYHKTSRRGMYDRHRSAHPEAFDVLLWNEAGELTEFTIGNLVVELGGVRWTPPLRSGLLPGVFRDALLEAGLIRERVLTRADLEEASEVWLINSLREWVPVRLA
jgi:para-aminobenzoate synthetase / 4-amino-4-deoxychorismate lyase